MPGSAQNIETGASNLAYLSNDYFQNKQSGQLTLWQNQFSSISKELSQINPSSSRLTELTNNVQSDMQQLGTVFNNSAAYLQSIPANESGIVHPLLKTYTTRLNLQNQALAFDASVLTKALTDQVDQLRQTNSLLIFVLLGAFLAYFVTVYFISYRRTFRSITKLQEDTKIIGSGNLNYSINTHSNDEIGDLSRAFNQMTTNLKTVTASKDDLEIEIGERKKAEEALSESEARLRAYVTSTSDVVYRMNADWSEMRQLCGQNFIADTDEPDRSWMKKYIHPDDQQHVKEVIKRAIETKGIFELEHKVIQVDGSLGWTFSRAIPLLDKDGEIIEWFSTAKDVTERKKAEDALVKAEAHYRYLFDNLDEGFELIEVIRNEKGDACDFRYLEVNKVYEKLTGVKASEVLGKTTSEVYPGSENYWLEAFGNVERTGEPASFENYSKPLHSYFQTYSFPFGKNQVGVLIRNITERKELQNKLEQYAINLET